MCGPTMWIIDLFMHTRKEHPNNRLTSLTSIRLHLPANLGSDNGQKSRILVEYVISFSLGAGVVVWYKEYHTHTSGIWKYLPSGADITLATLVQYSQSLEGIFSNILGDSVQYSYNLTCRLGKLHMFTSPKIRAQDTVKVFEIFKYM